MAVELVFINWPAEKIEDIKGLATKEAVNELKVLINASDLHNLIIEIPKKDDENYPTEVKSRELKNFLLKYSGKKVLVISDEIGPKKTANFK